MNRKIRMGVIGVGALGQHHARIYSELEQVELVGVCDNNLTRAEELAAKFKTRAFSSPDQLAPLIEAASIVVPTET